MRVRRPVVGLLVAAAAILVLGRAGAVMYSEWAWYAALGAESMWRERIADAVLLHGLTFIAAAAFAFANFSAVRHSILSLVLPRRLGNVEFGEAVAPRRLDAVALAFAVAVAGAAAPAVPSWTALALVRAGVRFGESDPYHQLDLGYYTSWLPLELSIHRWAWLVVALVTAAVVGLYALTPGLRWESGAVRMTAYVRRHLAVLTAVMLLMLAWRSRLVAFTLLYEGSGADGAFTAVDHRWMLPGYLVLSIGTVAAAALFVWSAWSRQMTLSATALAGAVIMWAGVTQILPVLGGARAPATRATSLADAPYVATREAFTRRAFDVSDGAAPAERDPPGTQLMRTPAVARATRLALVAPGARGYLIVGESGTPAAAPGVAEALSRLAHAWREQNARLLRADLPPNPRILRVRDVEARVRRLAPVFAQGSRHAALFRADTLYWVTELYTTFTTYPLSRRYTIAGERRGYFRHAATAYTHSTTGKVAIVTDPDPEPLSRAWARRFPEIFTAPRAPPAWIAELSLEPAEALLSSPGAVDPAFRERVRQLYLRMRAALSTSDLSAFGIWFDSLGQLLERGSAQRR